MILSLRTHKSSKTKDKATKKKLTKEETLKIKNEKKEERQLLRDQGRKVAQLIEDWKDIMYQTGTKNQDNITFTFGKITYEQYGFKAYLYCPKGLTFKSLDTIRDKIEDGLNCIFIYNKERLDKYMEVRIVTQLSTEKRYSPPKTLPWEIYIGDRFDGTPIVIDLNKWCQILISGTTGGGKSKLIDCILTTQVYNHTEKDLWLFPIQLDKCDLLAYEDTKICKGFADNLDKAVVVLEFLMEELKKRNKLVAIVKKKFKGSNITDYNAYQPSNRQPTILVVLDEMASIAEKSSDNPATKAKKQMIDDMLSAVAQYGRSNNVFLISCLQRPTAQLLNSFIKSMSNLKISFRQSNSKSSEVAMDDSSIALDLAQRIAVFKLLSYDFLQTPYIDDPLIETFIKNKLQSNHMTIFDSCESSKRLEELKSMGNKGENKKSDDNSGTSSTETGKQEVSYEQQLKQIEQEINERFSELTKKEKLVEESMKKLNLISKMKSEQFKDTCEKIDPKYQENNIVKIVEENKKKIPNFVEWTPPPQTGKEKVK